MSSLNDLERRLSSVMKNEKLMLNIGDVTRITGLTVSQIHYWERRGYIKSVKRSKNSNHFYSHATLIKIEMIQSYLKSGFTLKVADQKASQGYQYGTMIRDVILQCFKRVTRINGFPALDFGPLTSNPHRELFFVIGHHNREVRTLIRRFRS